MLPRGTIPGLKQCFLKDGVLCHKFHGPSNLEYAQLVLLSTLHHLALQHFHIELGHMGLHKTTEAIKQRYYCTFSQKIMEKVQGYLKRCNVY